jgi:hypothetical protein
MPGKKEGGVGTGSNSRHRVRFARFADGFGLRSGLCQVYALRSVLPGPRGRAVLDAPRRLKMVIKVVSQLTCKEGWTDEQFVKQWVEYMFRSRGPCQESAATFSVISQERALGRIFPRRSWK